MIKNGASTAVTEEKLICTLMCPSHTRSTFVCSEFMLTHSHVNLWQQPPKRSHIGDNCPLHTACEFRRRPAGGTASDWRRTAQGCWAAELWHGSSIEDLWDWPLGWGHHAPHMGFWYHRATFPLDVAAVARKTQIFSEKQKNTK